MSLDGFSARSFIFVKSVFSIYKRPDFEYIIRNHLRPELKSALYHFMFEPGVLSRGASVARLTKSTQRAMLAS